MLPWNDTSPETEQERFIERWQVGGVSFVEICREFGISRKTGYKRVHRFESFGLDGLGDWSRAPRHRPSKTPSAVAERLILERRNHPTWGPKKLVAWLRAAEPEGLWPAPSTVGEILQRAGMLRRGARRLQLRTSLMTCGPSTSRGGSARAMVSGSTLSHCRTSPRVICWSARTCRGPEVHMLVKS